MAKVLPADPGPALEDLCAVSPESQEEEVQGSLLG